MKKFIFVFALFAVFGLGAVSAHADSTCTIENPCGNGSPENVVNVWGTKNSQLPHIKPGETRVLLNGRTDTCPAWYPFDCVDITGTQYWISRWGNL